MRRSKKRFTIIFECTDSWVQVATTSSKRVKRCIVFGVGSGQATDVLLAHIFNARTMNMELLDCDIFDFDDFGDICGSFSDYIPDDFNLGELETSSDTSSGPSVSDSTNNSSKRQRSEKLQQLQQNYKLSRPRIVKSDFRRKFPQILAGVFNSADYSFLRCHINTFYDNNVSILQQDMRSGTANSFFVVVSILRYIPCSFPQITTYCTADTGPDRAELDMSCGLMTGHDYLSEFWYRSMNIAPDLVCTIKRSFIKLRADGTSTITCTFGLAGTEVLSVDGLLSVANTNKVVYVRPVLDAAKQLVRVHDLDQYVANESPQPIKKTNVIGVVSDDKQDPTTQQMQEVLQQYLKTSDAVARRKAQAKTSKEGPRKRRKRLLYSDFASQVALEDWLSIETPSVSISSPCNIDLDVHTGLYKRHPCQLRNRVCASRISEYPQSSGTDSVDRSYKVEHSPQGDVMLTAQFNAECYLEVNFNAGNKIVSLNLQYRGQVPS